MRRSFWGRVSLLVPALSVSLTPAAFAEPPCDRPAAGDTPLEIRSPVRGGQARLTAGFGLRRHPILNRHRLHSGIDWSAPLGTPVSAAGKGRVLSADYAGAYGNRVVIDHGNGWQTLYGQLARISVRAGDCVDANAEIGAVGSTGLSAEPHLHFEVRRGGVPIDPMLVPVKQDGIDN